MPVLSVLLFEIMAVVTGIIVSFGKVLAPECRWMHLLGKLADAINDAFGSFDEFKTKFAAAGVAGLEVAGPG